MLCDDQCAYFTMNRAENQLVNRSMDRKILYFGFNAVKARLWAAFFIIPHLKKAVSCHPAEWKSPIFCMGNEEGGKIFQQSFQRELITTINHLPLRCSFMARRLTSSLAGWNHSYSCVSLVKSFTSIDTH